MRLYIHRATKRYLDYGDLLSTEHGIAWSSTGFAGDAFGFEAGATVEGKRRLFRDLGAHDAGFELVEGEHVFRSVDYNPHGLV